MLTVARLAGRRLGVPLPSERAGCAADASLLPANGRCGARVADLHAITFLADFSQSIFVSKCDMLQC